ncbi:MAG: hypothetical protein H0X65_14985 [Gemmatimonadetes bacterium]|nr:hypothetical protein [Gemmatimonadota bacterium]
MWNRKVALSGLAIAAVTLAGACADVPPTEPPGAELDAPLFSTRAASASAPRTLDEQFAQLAREVPGFGGLFYDEAGTLNVVMAGTQVMSTAQVATVLSGRLAALGIDAAAAQQAVVREGQYDFLQLSAMRSRADAVFGLRGVVFTDVDEAANRVHIGVENNAVAASVKHALGMLDIPPEAVIISITEPEVPMQTLRDRLRPIAGGLQIWALVTPTSGFICTVGFNVRSPAAPNVHGFVTNSHCTIEQGVVSGTVYSQKPFALPVEPIGVEVHDAPFFTDPCFEDAICRWSDAAGVRYEPGVENIFGRIYRTTEFGSLTVDPAMPMFNIVAERPRALMGDILHKVGRSTGWSQGPVFATCAHVSQAGTEPLQVMLCQDRFNPAPATQGGDSGSPVFERIGEGNDVRLVGILWGGTTFSPMENVRFENPGPRPWITYPGQTPPAP